MAAMSRLLPMMTFSTFALFLLALLATPTNALDIESRAHARGHSSIAKRKRAAVKMAKRCRPKWSDPTSALLESTQPAKPKDTPKTFPPYAPPTTPAPTNPGGGNTGLDPKKKFLMAWPNGPADIDKWNGWNVAGAYSWSPSDPTKGTIPFFPMLWGSSQKNSFAKLDGSKYKLCFGPNEPNHEGQANMSPGAAAALWKETMEPARQRGCKTVSPAIDFVAVHWYGTKSEELKSYVNKFQTTFNKDIIVSEYACQNFAGGPQCSKDQTNAFHQEMANWFYQNPKVAMYAPFGCMRDMVDVSYGNQLMSPDGSPNRLGRAYMNHDWSGF
ncbi:hypothetical protein FRC12_016833 [Ceratobasidium sp. 428]|nr:hypothetical protein FRC12_016833 [Ceratobasidium sp. 428]